MDVVYVEKYKLKKYNVIYLHTLSLPNVGLSYTCTVEAGTYAYSFSNVCSMFSPDLYYLDFISMFLCLYSV